MFNKFIYGLGLLTFIALNWILIKSLLELLICTIKENKMFIHCFKPWKITEKELKASKSKNTNAKFYRYGRLIIAHDKAKKKVELAIMEENNV